MSWSRMGSIRNTVFVNSETERAERERARQRVKMERKVSEGNGRKAEVKARETEWRGGRKRERDLLKREKRKAAPHEG